MKSSMSGQEKVTFKYRWLLNRGDSMGRFDCTLSSRFIIVFWVGFNSNKDNTSKNVNWNTSPWTGFELTTL